MKNFVRVQSCNNSDLFILMFWHRIQIQSSDFFLLFPLLYNEKLQITYWKSFSSICPASQHGLLGSLLRQAMPFSRLVATSLLLSSLAIGRQRRRQWRESNPYDFSYEFGYLPLRIPGYKLHITLQI